MGKSTGRRKTGENAGTINSANLDGTGAKQLLSIDAVPIGIAVDIEREQLYWTDSAGKLQSANLNGSVIQDVAEGLGSPGDMVLSKSIKRPGETSPQTPTSKATSDINGDSTVDDTDAWLLIEAIGNAATAAKYDVNADGNVDLDDLQIVLNNRDKNAAGAPRLLGNLKLTATQIARLEEQIELFIATGDRSPAAMRTLIYLQQLIATARPRENAVAGELSESVQPRNMDSLRVGDGYKRAHHDLRLERCSCPKPAARSSGRRLLYGSRACGVLGWSECARRTGGERNLFLPVRDRWHVVNAQDGNLKIVSYDHRIAGRLMFISFPVIADEWKDVLEGTFL